MTNKDGYPIASRAVSLLDAKGNTLFQTVTDNTGKAELWASLIGEQQNVSGLQIRVDDKVIAAKPWEKGLNTFVMDEPCEVSDAVDVMFVFDATGSMTDELHYLQAEMRDVIARAKDATGGLAIRTGAVVYRDHGDVYLTRISRLTESPFPASNLIPFFRPESRSFPAPGFFFVRSVLYLVQELRFYSDFRFGSSRMPFILI